MSLRRFSFRPAALVCCLTLGLCLAGAQTALAQAPFWSWLAPGLGPGLSSFSYHVDQAGAQEVAGQGGDLSYVRHQLAARLPLYQDQERQVLLSARLGLLALDTNAVLPDSGRRLPQELWSPGLGLEYRQTLSAQRAWGLSLAADSPSDRPLAGSRDLGLRASSYLRLPQGDRDAWLLMLYYDYDRNNDLLGGFPLPGLAYLYNPAPSFQALLGAPFMALRWQPAQDWDVNLSYFIPRSARARVAYKLSPGLRPYAQASFSHESWYLSDRTHSENRLFFYEKRAGLGVEFTLTRGLVLDLGGGWAWDRFFFEGENYDDRHQNKIELGSGAYLGAQLGLRF